MRGIFQTDKGKVRKNNEDYGGIFFDNYGHCLAVIADGMGGHNAGEVASQMAVKLLAETWVDEKAEMEELTPERAEHWLKKHVQHVNFKLHEHSLTHEECEGMGTTVVAAICSSGFATIAHIGDSRCYVINENGLNQLTEDHTLVNELIKTGQLAPEDAEHHPRKNVILRSLGIEETVEVDIKTITFETGDILLLCSDGLSNKVSEDEMHQIMMSSEDLPKIAKKLIDLSNEYGGEDNISVAIVHSRPESESGCESC